MRKSTHRPREYIPWVRSELNADGIPIGVDIRVQWGLAQHVSAAAAEDGVSLVSGDMVVGFPGFLLADDLPVAALHPLVGRQSPDGNVRGSVRARQAAPVDDDREVRVGRVRRGRHMKDLRGDLVAGRHGRVLLLAELDNGGVEGGGAAINYWAILAAVEATTKDNNLD